MEDFDEAVFQLEPLVQRTAKLFQARGQVGEIGAVAFVAMVVELQAAFGEYIQPRADLLGEFKAAIITKRLGFLGELFVYAEVPG